MSKISGPLLDRIDLHVAMSPTPWKDLDTPSTGPTSRVLQNPFQTTRLVKSRVAKLNEIVPGDGLTPFSTIAATTDGIDHLACQQGGDDGATVQDIWYLYTPSCTGTVTTSCGEVT